MPRIALALLLTTMCMVGPASAVPLNEVDSGIGRKERSAEAGGYPAGEAQAAAPWLAVQDALDRVARTLEAEQDKLESADARRRAEGDLDAQTGMWRWAFWMFWAVFAQCWLTAAGLVLIGFTLRYTKGTLEEARNATKAASAAAIASEAGAEAARESVRVAEDTAKRQLRAYITVAEITALRIAKSGIRANVRIRNTGQTPAHDVIFWGLCRVGPEVNFEERPHPESRFSRYVMGQGVELDFLVQTGPAANEEIIDLIIRRLRSLNVFGEIVYRDVFGDTQTLHYRYMLELGSMADSSDLRMRACPEGNKAT